MTTKHSTKRMLIASILVLAMCFTALVGTTFAWFTDSVTSGNNIIKTGTLDIVMEYWDGSAWVDAEGKVLEFVKASSDGSTEVLWEPGCTYQLPKFRIRNAGSLAAKILIKLNGITGDEKLMEVVDLTTTITNMPESVMTGSLGSQLAPFNNATFGVLYGTPDGTIIFDWNLMGEGVVSPNTGHTDTSPEFTITGHMHETAGNEYQDLKIEGVSITVIATQDVFEYDSIGREYDKNSTFPLGESASAEVGNENISAKVDVPADAPKGDYTVSLPEESVEVTNTDGNVSVKFDLDLLCNGEKVNTTGTEYTVTLKLPFEHPFVDITEVWHNGEEITDFTYNNETCEITFTTTHFSPFEVKYVDYASPSFDLNFTESEDEIAIQSGIFVNKNPADFDPSLKDADSEYIVADYVKDGVKYYVVSERANTIFVSNDQSVTEIALENGTYAVNYVAPGQLYSFFSGLAKNDFNTVYLLPGTYTEATTLNVSSSMDIIGLGDTDEVKVIKGYSTGSNQHLFNISGQKEDYIHVTLRNLYLDASEYNYNGTKARDNAAVQSIRKSKVKCYDLTVVKNTNKMDQCAFYVNANNTANGEYQNAYMYVENCNVQVSIKNCVVSTKNASYPNTAKWYFYHSGLVYNGTDYTQNSGNNKNVSMSADDWWD